MPVTVALTGTALAVVPSLPRLPAALFPQHQIVPSFRRAHDVRSLVSNLGDAKNNGSFRPVGEQCSSFRPCLASSLGPQHQTFWLLRRAHVLVAEAIATMQPHRPAVQTLPVAQMAPEPPLPFRNLRLLRSAPRPSMDQRRSSAIDVPVVTQDDAHVVHARGIAVWRPVALHAG